MTAALLELMVMPFSRQLLLCFSPELPPAVQGDAGSSGPGCLEPAGSSHLLSLACLRGVSAPRTV